jgi:AAA domain
MSTELINDRIPKNDEIVYPDKWNDLPEHDRNARIAARNALRHYSLDELTEMLDRFNVHVVEYSDCEKVAKESISRIKKLSEFKISSGNDPDELLKHRFLCRKGALLLVGATGLGKSSLAMQLMIKWSLGQPAFELEPARPLKSLLIQAENDDGDLAEMKFGVFNGLNLREEDQAKACENIFVTQECSKTGDVLCRQVIDPLLQQIKPDLLWLDPALAYIGGDMNSQKDVGKFLRNDVAPLLTKHNCGAVIIHHTNKISKDPEKQADVFYLGAGSAEWINFCRAMLALRKTDVDNLYELVAAKRGARLKWKAADGESLSFKKYVGHCKRPDTICWMEMAIAEAEKLRASNGKTSENVLKHVPPSALVAKEDLIKICQQNSIGKNLANELISELVDNEDLHEIAIRREGKRSKVLLSRQQVMLDPAVTFDSLLQNSQGYYIIPEAQEKPTKTL